MKSFSFIPNAFTLLNLFFGCVAVVLGLSGNLEYLLLFVVLGLICDFLDGFFARLLKVNSTLGVQLDSLSDLVSFGMTSSVVMFLLIQKSELVLDNTSNFISYLPYFGFLITIASSYRLAKFNISSDQSSFIGLPTPANAILIVFIPFLFEQFNKTYYLENTYFLISIVIVSSYLLICNMKMFSFKLKNLKFNDNRLVFIFVSLSLLLFVFFKIAAFPLTIILYLLFNLFRIKF
jgi:CDP-diacylglycerol--serine O-phosphatidyltransferase|tara:strand:+ start:6390 stop:7091 length:702 start_codon:yes stop_codon:yes gene_type:complete